MIEHKELDDHIEIHKKVETDRLMKLANIFSVAPSIKMNKSTISTKIVEIIGIVIF